MEVLRRRNEAGLDELVLSMNAAEYAQLEELAELMKDTNPSGDLQIVLRRALEEYVEHSNAQDRRAAEVCGTACVGRRRVFPTRKRRARRRTDG